MTREPSEKPTRVIGLAPRFRSINESARISPADCALSSDTVHGLSMRYESFVRTIGSCNDAISATKIVLPRTCCNPCVRA